MNSPARHDSRDRRWWVLGSEGRLNSGRRPKRTLRLGRWQGLDLRERMCPGSIESPEGDQTTSTGIGKPKYPQALNFCHHRIVLEDGLYPDEIETRVGRESDQKRRRRLFLHDVHEAFLSKQTALAISKTGSQPRQRVRRERNSGLANVSGRG